MRIGFEAKRLFLNDRGLGNYARNLLYGLIKYKPEHQYHLYTPKFSNDFLNSELINESTVEVHEPSGLIGKISKSAWRSFQLGSVSLKENLDVFHGLSQELPKDIRKSKAKSIVTIHDMIFLKYPEFYSAIDRRIYYSKVKFAVHNADHIIAISEQSKSDLINTFKLAEERISVIYQSCNEVFYETRTIEELKRVKQKWELPENYILYVGALNENKNVIAILEAFKKLKQKVDLPLVIVGNGETYKNKLIKYAAKHSLSNRLIFASEVANPTPLELSSFYQMASLFIFPSFYEGFGIPILEARFSKTPVIASNSSCLEEAGSRKSSYFNPTDSENLADELLKILSNHAATSQVENIFTLKKSSEQLTSLYQSL
jgi:glycosyltransferase involved in cell wall biosynthesis